MNDRFVLPDDYIYDYATKLYWKRSPLPELMVWNKAIVACKEIGARLPTVQEFVAFLDYSQYHPTLPESHPFLGVQTAYYWSSSIYAACTANAWGVNLSGGTVFTNDKANKARVWPVRN